MKQTQDKAILELDHLITGDKQRFVINEESSPAILDMIEKRGDLQREMAEIRKRNEGKNGKPDFKNSVNDLTRLNEISNTWNQLGFQIVAVLIAPEGGWKKGTDRVEYIKPFLSSYDYIDAITEIFFYQLKNTTGSQEDYRKRMDRVISSITVNGSKGTQKKN